MIERLAPLILLSTLSIGQTKEDGDQISLTLVKPGNNFTMTCSVDKTDAGLIYWYRMSFGSTVQTIAECSYDKMNLQGKFNNPKFNVSKVNTLYSLTVFKVTKEDEASYFCQAGSSYKMAFFNATLLVVLDQRSHTYYVEQSPSVSAPLGGLAKLNCSLLSKNNRPVQCPSKRSVYWFRSGSEESRPNIIYTYNNQDDEQDQRKCVYGLSKTIQDFNDTGTYYCAVATCGQIQFGQGTRVEMSTPLDLLWPVCVALGLLLLCSTVINAVMFCRYRKVTHYRGVTSTSNHFELMDTIMEDQSNNEVGHVAGVNYVALDFPLRKVKRPNKNNGLPPDCLYSATRDYQ